MSYEEFCRDEWQIDAVLHNFTLIGEASRRIPDEVKSRYPDIRWKEMRDMRIIVVHQYFGVDLSIIWQTIQEDLPVLVRQIEEILQKEH